MLKTESKPPSLRLSPIVLLAGIMAIGLFLRTFDLGRTALWIDEITIVMFGAPPRTSGEIIRHIYESKFSSGATGQHMPAQYLLSNWIQQIHPWTGTSEDVFWLRLPFALLGVATIAMVYLSAKRFYGYKAGMWSAFLLSTSFFHVYISRDGTSYSPLLFFLAMNWWGMAEWLQLSQSPIRRKIALCIYGLGAFGALFSHMTAWLTLGAQGLFLIIAHARAVRATRGTRRDGSYFRGPYITCAFVLIASIFPMLPIVVDMSQFNQTTAGSSAEPLSWAMLKYQLAFFGWGQGNGRLIAFLVAVITGLFFLLRQREKRFTGLFHLGLIFLPAVLFFIILSRDFYPRYLAVIYLPLLGLAGVGLAALSDSAKRMVKRPVGEILVCAAIVCALAVAHLQPFRILFSMSDKLYPVSKVRDWVLTNVPEGGLYVWRNSYFLREIPQTLSVGRRFTAESDYPNIGVPDSVYEARSQNVRSYFQRIPLGVLIVEPDTDYTPKWWTWIHTDFAQKVKLSVYDELETLWKRGFSYMTGYKKPNPFNYFIYYNTEDDVIRRSRENGQLLFVFPKFGQWHLVQANTMQLFLTPAGSSVLRVYNMSSKPLTASIFSKGMANDSGKIMVRQERDNRLVSRNEISFKPSPSIEINLGRYEFPPGLTDLNVIPVNAVKPALFLYSFDIRVDPMNQSK